MDIDRERVIHSRVDVLAELENRKDRLIRIADMDYIRLDDMNLALACVHFVLGEIELRRADAVDIELLYGDNTNTGE